jgi:hypothetical protein
MHDEGPTGVDIKLLDLGPLRSSTSSVRTARNDESEQNYKISMYISRQHCGAIERAHHVSVCKASFASGLAFDDLLFWITGAFRRWVSVLGSTSLYDDSWKKCLCLIHHSSIYSVYTT